MVSIANRTIGLEIWVEILRFSCCYFFLVYLFHYLEVIFYIKLQLVCVDGDWDKYVQKRGSKIVKGLLNKFYSKHESQNLL